MVDSKSKGLSGKGFSAFENREKVNVVKTN